MCLSENDLTRLRLAAAAKRDDEFISITAGELRALVEAQLRMNEALAVAEKHGGTDGAHHKAWVIDQMVRALVKAWVKAYRFGDEGPHTYEWDEGIAP